MDAETQNLWPQIEAMHDCELESDLKEGLSKATSQTCVQDAVIAMAKSLGKRIFLNREEIPLQASVVAIVEIAGEYIEQNVPDAPENVRDKLLLALLAEMALLAHDSKASATVINARSRRAQEVRNVLTQRGVLGAPTTTAQ
ncbi:hypothetical protein A2881_05675 [Candidatus Peribacteria bacterium RIFCSPHIGHO2_01_FULL_55_13]|nr:MAG: hypothetical protein A2881_05675 [Candidatus Peribacteria bacterium RIFCSPHIGHO2_01_FULL_55_13]OGJ64478.1 MAG: hypothetical protein A3F36_03975 [Candidatus Peribacteria bacterium RIFCSPHIGHO2_12_FULL_55_11]